jgi:peptide deformylase
MTKLDILFYPNPELNIPAKDVDLETQKEELGKLVEDMEETAKAHNAEGLAATQVDVNQNVLIIRDHSTEDLRYRVFLNSSYTSTSKDMIFANEGCLSFPGVDARIQRFVNIEVRYQNEAGAWTTEALSGFSAVAFQHEHDHIIGKTFVDRAGAMEKRMLMKKIARVKKQNDLMQAQFEKMLKSNKITTQLVKDETEIMVE